MALGFLYKLIDTILCNTNPKSPSEPKIEETVISPPIVGNVVFTDIDGVLHPGCSETLKYLPNLYRVLDAYPDLKIVICSNWRETASFEYLQSLFDVQYRHRMVGVTPSLPTPAGGGSKREAEINSFLANNQIKNWVVIDDEPQRYGNLNKDRIFTTDTLTALDEVTTQHFIVWLRDRCPG